MRPFLSLLSLQEAARTKSYGKERNSRQAVKNEKKKKCSIIQINRSWCVLPALGSVERGFSAGFGGIRIGMSFCQSGLSTLREKIRVVLFYFKAITDV